MLTLATIPATAIGMSFPYTVSDPCILSKLFVTTWIIIFEPWNTNDVIPRDTAIFKSENLGIKSSFLNFTLLNLVK